MIQKLAINISTFLCKNKMIKEEEAGICRYGFEIIISTTIGFGAIITVGAIFQETITAIIYLVFIVPLRMYTGGYHADTYLKCNVVFSTIFVIVLFIYKMSIYYALQIPIMVVSLFSFILILKYGPVESKNKPISGKDRHKFLKISLILGSVYYLSSLLLTMLGIDYGVLIILVVDTVAILMMGGEEVEQISSEDFK